MQSAQVSILTRPGGRVQPASARYSPDDHHRFNPHPSRRTGATICLLGWDKSGSRVSILTRPGGRVQPFAPVLFVIGASASFNPHPSRRTGATRLWSAIMFACAMFQSSPVPEDGCNILPSPASSSPTSFNPHPSRRTGATMPSATVPPPPTSFQSSPVPEDGCNM